MKRGVNVCSKCMKIKTKHDSKYCKYPEFHIFPSHLMIDTDDRWKYIKMINNL